MLRRSNKMNRLFLTAILTLPLCVAQQPAATGRGARPAGAVQPGGPVAPGGSISIREYPSNQQSGVETDRFIGYPTNSFTKVVNGLMTRSMLTAGDPYHP